MTIKLSHTFFLSLLALLCAHTTRAAESSIVEFELLAGYESEQVPADDFFEEKYSVFSSRSQITYTVGAASSSSRQGVRLYHQQALASIPLIHNYELIFESERPLGFIFKKPDGYLIEYMRDVGQSTGVYISVEIQGDEYLHAVHEALDILSRFSLAR